jgi:hypothetical protein
VSKRGNAENLTSGALRSRRPPRLGEGSEFRAEPPVGFGAWPIARRMRTQSAWRTALAFARRRPWSTTAAVVLLAAFAWSTSWVPRLLGVVRSDMGQPVADAWVAYGYLGGVPYPSPCGTRHIPVRRAGGIVRTDAGGRFTIPGRLHLLGPSMQLQIHGVFAPALHSSTNRDGHAITAFLMRHPPKGSLAHADFADAELEFEIFDCSDSPRLWLNSLACFQAAAIGVFRPTALDDADRTALASMLIGEYRAFLAAHAATVPDRNDSYGEWSEARNARSYEPYVQRRVAELTPYVR